MERLKTVDTKIKRSKIFQKTGKTPKTSKGPSSVEDIKAKMQASIEKVSKAVLKKTGLVYFSFR